MKLLKVELVMGKHEIVLAMTCHRKDEIVKDSFINASLKLEEVVAIFHRALFFRSNAQYLPQSPVIREVKLSKMKDQR